MISIPSLVGAPAGASLAVAPSLARASVAAGGGGGVTPTPGPALALSIPAPSIASNAATGTLVSNITNVPSGATPTVTPNDGRLVIAGDSSAGWKVVVGMSALSAGTVNFSVAATGATGVSGVLTVTAATPAPSGTPVLVTVPNYATMAALGDSITAGSQATTNSNRWANRVATSLGAGLLNAGIADTFEQNSPVVSGGVNRQDNGRDRFFYAILNDRKRASAFIAYGLNDARYSGYPTGVNADNFKIDRREIVTGLILSGLPTLDVYTSSPYYMTDLGLAASGSGYGGNTRAWYEGYVTAARAVADEFGVPFCDLYAYLRDQPSWSSEIDANDKIHPKDGGHALIAQAWLTQTYITNPRPVPASVSISASGAAVTVTCPTVTNAVSYEYAIITNPFWVDQNASGSFPTAVPGTYHGAARAVFSDGSKGPWKFSTVIASVAAPMGIFLSETFSGTAGTALLINKPTIGGDWQLVTGYSTSGSARISTANRLYGGVGSIMQNLAVPGSADYYVEADVVRLTAVGVPGLLARCSRTAWTYIRAFWVDSVSSWRVSAVVNGVDIPLGTDAADTFTSGTKRMRLECQGSAIRLLVDGVLKISVTDTTITEAGTAGILLTSNTTSTTGFHLDNVQAGTL